MRLLILLLAVRGRSVVRASPEHQATAEDCPAAMVQGVICDDAEGTGAHTLLAAVQEGGREEGRPWEPVADARSAWQAVDFAA